MRSWRPKVPDASKWWYTVQKSASISQSCARRLAALQCHCLKMELELDCAKIHEIAACKPWLSKAVAGISIM